MSADLRVAQAALAAWPQGARSLRLEPAGAGNINPTWFVTDHAGPHYVLQQINAHVFPDPLAVLENQRLLIAHIEARARGFVVPLLATSSGADYHLALDGAVWRLQPFVTHSRATSRVEDPHDLGAASGAFGRFQALLADLDPARLRPVIPHFHDLDWQIARLDACIAAAPSRLPDVAEECRFVNARRALGTAYRTESEAPRGLIHGDCKVSNVLFAAADAQVLAVIDLDTAMYGARALDFGDLVRSAFSGNEFESPAAIDTESLRILGHGFMRGLGDSLAQAGGLRASLSLAPCYMAFMLGIRFLIDHLEGDRYFRLRRPGDNLLRARRQFELTRAFEDAQPLLERVLVGA